MHSISTFAASSLDLQTITLAGAAVLIVALLFVQLHHLLSLRSLLRVKPSSHAKEGSGGEIIDETISQKEADPLCPKRCLSLAQDNKTAIDNLEKKPHDLDANLKAACADVRLMIAEAELPALRSLAAAIGARVDTLHSAISEMGARTEESLSKATASAAEVKKFAGDAAAVKSVTDELKVMMTQVGSDLSELQSSATEISACMDRLQLSVSNASSKSADSLLRITEGGAATIAKLGLLDKKVDNRFDEWLHVNASWLATPYPSRFKFLLGEDVSYLFATRGASVRAQPVCEQCSAIPDEEHPYNIQDARLYVSEKNIAFLAEAGIGVAIFALGSQVPSLPVVAHDPKLVGLITAALAAASHIPEDVKKTIRSIPPKLGAEVLSSYWKSRDTKKILERKIPEATKLLENNELDVVTVGGSSHHHLGRLIKDIDNHDERRQPFGGLVRVLIEKKEHDESAPCYRWVCRKCWAKLNGVPQLPSV
jgi:hypothetical protein